MKTNINMNTQTTSVANIIYDFINYHNNSSERGDGIVSFTDDNSKIDYKPSATIDDAASQISRSGESWNGKNIIGKPAKVTYSFYNWSDWPNAKELTNEQKVAVRKSLQAWEDVANISFFEVAPNTESDLNFGNYDGHAHGHICTYACAYLPQSGFKAGQVWFNTKNNSVNLNHNPGSYDRFIITHEIGHSIGLRHPGDYSEGSNPSYSKNAPYGEDTRQFSVMSYWSEKYQDANFSGYYSSSPLIDDIAAIQVFHGAKTTIRSADTTYGFHSNTNRDWYTISGSDQQVVFSVWDGGGNDTFNFSGYNENQRINLREGSFSDVGKLKGNVSIAKGVSIEHAVGGKGDDIIVGNDKDNTIIGGHGNDIICGGKGKDTLWGDFEHADESNFGMDTFILCFR